MPRSRLKIIRDAWAHMGSRILQLPPLQPGEGIDMDFVRELVPSVDAFCRAYFRQEVEGIADVPTGPVLMVGNHNAGSSFLELFGLGARWYMERGFDEPLYGLSHDVIVKLPWLKRVLVRAGAIRASHEDAGRALGEGAKVLVFPGGNSEAFRPYRRRYEVDFAGHKGFVRLALRAQVPIVPMVFVGGHETFYVIRDGRRLVKWLGLKRLARVDTFPLILSVPWGLTLGPIMHLPLPAKCSVRLLEAIPVDSYGPEAADDPAVVDALYEQVHATMQANLSEMGARRRFPVLG